MMRPKRNKIEYIPVKELKIHPVAQRKITKAGLRKIDEKFDLEVIGTLDGVSYERDGEWGTWIVNGQHRLTILLKRGYGEMPIGVVIHPCDSDTRAAELFLLLGTTTIIAPYDKYLNKLAAGEPAAVGVEAIATKHGYKVTRGAGDGCLACSQTMEKVWEWNEGESLDQSIGILKDAFGYRSDAGEGKLVHGLSLIMARHNGAITESVITKKLSKYPGGAAGILGDAKGLMRIRKSTLPYCTAETILAAYNSGRQEQNKLALP